MKVILSRKGFDSAYGGAPSVITSDGAMLSLPILDIPDKDGIVDEDTFETVKLSDGVLASDVLMSLEKRGVKLALPYAHHCHMDPDFYWGAKDRVRGWTGCFGQSGAALGHLESKKVEEGDLFLFFGWFDKTPCGGRREGDGFHAFFGYLQIGEIFDLTDKDRQVEARRRFPNHPHVATCKYGKSIGDGGKGRNAIFVAREMLDMEGLEDLPGWGMFSFSEELRLSRKGEVRLSWALPTELKEIGLSYHSEKSWGKPIGDGTKSEFKSAMIGQEFVFEEDERVTNWARTIIRAGCK